MKIFLTITKLGDSWTNIPYAGQVKSKKDKNIVEMKQ